MKQSQESTDLWYASTAYNPAGGPTLVRMLMAYATTQFLNTAVHEDRFPELVADIRAEQDDVREGNKRLKPVVVSLDEAESYITRDIRRLRIGDSFIVFYKVRSIY